MVKIFRLRTKIFLMGFEPLTGGYLELKSDWLISKIHFARDLAAIVCNGASVDEGFAGTRATESVN